MSKTKRREQAARRAMAARPVLSKLLHESHLRTHPGCTYGSEPHFVPPSLGQIGFYLCDVPDDLTNHTRCSTPYDHEHADHRP